MSQLTRDEALALMIDALASDAPRQFHVGIVGYFIDGVPYSADGLAVSPDRTPNLIATHDGFACDAFFPPLLLDDATVKARGVMTLPNGADAVQVRLEVKRRDTWAIAEFINGVQHNLFLDADVVITRKVAFAQERALWLARDERPH